MNANPLIAKKKLTLNVDRVTVGLGQSWVSDAEQVIWAGKLYNNGSVVLAGTAQGDVDNLADSFVTRTDPPNQGTLAGSYKLNPPVYDQRWLGASGP